MNADFPLEQLVRHRRQPQQAAFAARAQSILPAQDDCLLVASERGLVLRGRNEEALAAPRAVLQDAFGAEPLDIAPIRVRLLPGTPPCEPIMHVRIDAPLSLRPQVLWALQRRRVALLEQDAVHARSILRGEGQAARLLGLGDELHRLGDASVQLQTALSRYVPLAPDPLWSA